jgi:myo-inositol-1(or 4)-monophosphatase
MALSDVDLARVRRVAIEATEAAGALLRARAGNGFTIAAKGAGDVVTDLDVAAERVIVAKIRASFPGHRIITEEAGVLGPDSRYCWLVDPLDGTNNLAIGLPAYAVGVALCDHRLPVVTAIHEPVASRTWSAIRGRGAWGPDGGRLHRHSDRPRARPLLAWTQGYRVAADDHTAAALRLLADRNSARMLQLWAPLLCWTMLARGDVDGLVGYRVGELDLHPGALLAVEAGLVLRDMSGAPFDVRLTGLEESRSLVAAPADEVPRLVALAAAARRVAPAVGDVWTASRTVGRAVRVTA